MKIKRNTRELPAMMSDWLRVYLLQEPAYY